MNKISDYTTSMPQSIPTQTLWNSVNLELQKLFPADIYDMWFAGIECLEESDNAMKLTAPSEFNAIWIQSNYIDVIAQQARGFAGTVIKVSIEAVQEPVEEKVVEPKPSEHSERARASLNRATEKARQAKRSRSLLNPRNTFENFVVGSGNQLAHAASIAVANAPGRAYNPLFVYGDTGLGKTHLMHAVAHQMLLNNPSANIAYISTEKFTNEFIHAIRENKLGQFRKRYRTVDALLVDDIHFLSGKESTQEEFFHTFNDLFESGHQIFLASDRPANEIEKLENRLISRFQWGLVTDIQAPDFETRVAILRKKAESLNIQLESGILDFLAERVSRNVRRMEGALTRIASYSSLIGRKVDLEAVERLLADLLQEEAASKVTVEQIQKKVADYYQLRLSEMLGRRRSGQIVLPRQIAMYISRTLTSDPLKSIGDAFGGRDHGTVIHACKQVENMMEQDGTVKRGVDYLIKQLAQNRA
ncbi:MAG: chromosomal replication initiator protein DnaA [Verrucomicrobiota bacterium]